MLYLNSTIGPAFQTCLVNKLNTEETMEAGIMQDIVDRLSHRYCDGLNPNPNVTSGNYCSQSILELALQFRYRSFGHYCSQPISY